MRKGLFLFFISLSIFVGLVVVYYFLHASQAPTPTNRLKLAATIFPITDMLRQVGGDRVEVVTLMPPGANVHTFEPTPQTVATAANAVALFKIGQKLDDWSQKITDASGLPTIDLSRHIQLRLLGNQPDPHYWLTYANAAVMVDELATSLADLDPAYAVEYRSRADMYVRQLLQADAALKQKFALLKNHKIATFHEAWFYFGERYGVQIVAAFEPSPGKEPEPQSLALMDKIIKDNQLKVLFTEPQISSAVIQQTAQDLGIKLENLDPIGGSSPETDSYIKLMQYNSDRIAAALSE